MTGVVPDQVCSPTTTRTVEYLRRMSLNGWYFGESQNAWTAALSTLVGHPIDHTRRGMSGRLAPAKTVGEPTYAADVLRCHREWAT